MTYLRLVALLMALPVLAQRPVTFGQIHADLYGTGDRAVILAHGGRFDEKSWNKQADSLAHAGFLILALRFRGDAPNPDGSPGSFGSAEDNSADVLAAASYLHQTGTRTIYAVGGSLGGDAVGDANAKSPGSSARIVILASTGGDTPEKLNGRKLFIVARKDRNSYGLRLPSISQHYARVPQPKKLVILNGSAHAQFLFVTDQGPRLLNEMLSFLSAP